LTNKTSRVIINTSSNEREKKHEEQDHEERVHRAQLQGLQADEAQAHQEERLGLDKQSKVW